MDGLGDPVTEHESCSRHHGTTLQPEGETKRGLNMMKLLSLPGPHDTPFAAPLMAGALLAFTLGFVILKLLDRVIKQDR